MKAKLKQNYRWGSVQIGGVEIVKKEFRELPDALCLLHEAVLEFYSKEPKVEPVKLPKIEVAPAEPEPVYVESKPAEPIVVEPTLEDLRFENKRKSKYNNKE